MKQRIIIQMRRMADVIYTKDNHANISKKTKEKFKKRLLKVFVR